jgi:N-acetylmuramoyl-L-alanine amidase
MKRGRASFHWLIPDENEDQHEKFIWACVPEALAAWHVQNSKSHPDVWAGKNRINHWSLGIEIVNSQSPTDFFSDWQIMVTAQIVRRCWAKYPNLRHVVSHAKIDPTRRSDPGVNFPWSKFRDLVLSSEIDMLDMYLGVPAVRDISTEQEISGCCEG